MIKADKKILEAKNFLDLFDFEESLKDFKQLIKSLIFLSEGTRTGLKAPSTSLSIARRSWPWNCNLVPNNKQAATAAAAVYLSKKRMKSDSLGQYQQE